MVNDVVVQGRGEVSIVYFKAAKFGAPGASNMTECHPMMNVAKVSASFQG